MRKKNLIKTIVVIGIPVLFALGMRGVFGIRDWEALYSVMLFSFLFLVPFGIGALCIALSGIEKVKSRAYRIFFPWVPILVFFFLTIAFSIEGWACWIMILPLFLIAASLGGLTAAYFKLRKAKNENIYVSAIAFLPLLIAPLEQSIQKIPGQYKAYTVIDIKAPKEKIWSNVTRVRGIERKEDKGWLTRTLGFPRPIKAELNYEGVGAYRKAIFDKGLIFHETVTEYDHQKKMVFSIKANPYEIPSTTMDEHVVVGGNYFDVLNGTYELEQLDATTCRLHLYSHFKLATTFNFYASIWAGWIMKDIQQNILQVIKVRSEAL